VIPVDSVEILVPLIVVVAPVALLEVSEPLPMFAVVESVALIAVDDTLVSGKTVVAADPPCPLVPDTTVEPVPVVPGIKTLVVCVTPVVSRISKRKTFIS
jgi:hypothetical protein